MIKRFQKECSIFRISADVWSGISSFFHSSGEVFSVLLSSKSLYEVFHRNHINFCENVVFKIRCCYLEGEFDFQKWLSNRNRENYVSHLKLCLNNIFKGTTTREEKDTKMKLLRYIFRGNPNETLRILLLKFPRLKIFDTNFNPYNRPIKAYLFNEMKKNINFFFKLDFRSLQHSSLLNTLRISHFDFLEEPVNVFNELSKHLPQIKYLSLSCFDMSTILTPTLRITGLGKMKLKSLEVTRSTIHFLESNDYLETLKISNVHPCFLLKPRKTLSFKNLKTLECSIGGLSYLNSDIYKEERIDELLPSEMNFETILRNSNNLENIKLECDVICFQYRKYDRNIKYVDNQRNRPLLPLLDKIFENTKKIRTLDISDFDNFSGKLFTYFHKTITSLNIDGCLLIQESSMLGSTLLENLIDLDISNCTQFTNLLFLSYPKLRSLKLASCTQEDISSKGFKSFEELRFLDISGCFQKSIDSKLVGKLFKKNTKLKKVQVVETDSRYWKTLPVHITREMMIRENGKKVKKVDRPRRVKISHKRGSEFQFWGEARPVSYFEEFWDFPLQRERMNSAFVHCIFCDRNVESSRCNVCQIFSCKNCTGECSGCGGYENFYSAGKKIFHCSNFCVCRNCIVVKCILCKKKEKDNNNIGWGRPSIGVNPMGFCRKCVELCTEEKKCEKCKSIIKCPRGCCQTCGVEDNENDDEDDYDEEEEEEDYPASSYSCDDCDDDGNPWDP